VASRATAAVLAAIAAAALLGACEDEERAAPKRADRSPAGRPAAEPRPRSLLTRLIPPPEGVLPAARVPARIGQLVSRMPLERKVAQLLLVGFDGTDSSAPFFDKLRRLELGGVVVRRFNYTGGDSLDGLTEAVANAAAGRTRLPPFVLAQQEGGDFSAFPDLPPGLLPGEIETSGDAADLAGRTARALKRAGLNGMLGPVVDVSGGGGVLGDRAYSDEPARVRAYARGVVGAGRRPRVG
jgi:hypothetical protein